MMQNTTLLISGMSCASCVGRIEKALTKEPAVKSASVNLATEKASISYDNDKISPERLIELIKTAGYEAQLEEITKKQVSRKSNTLTREKLLITVSALLSLPLVLPMLLGPLGINFDLSSLIQFILATPVQFYIGARFYRGALAAIKARSGNMDVLVALGTSAAYFLSLYLMMKHGISSHQHLYFESSAVIITLVLLGKFFEARAKHETTRAIEALQELRPLTARVMGHQGEKEIPIEKLKLGDTVIILPGERIPVDGIIQKGSTQVDESLITGESLPVSKKPGDQIIGGAINADGRIEAKVSALGAETMLSKIIRMIEDAQAKKAPVQRLVDKISGVFVPVVVLIAILTIIITGFLSGDWEHAIVTGVAVLVIACPCALGLATPTSIMVGTGVAAKAGVLIKDAEALEITHSLTTIAFDKTGTLTEGRPELVSLHSHSQDNDRILSLFSALQSGSEHPLAKATLRKARSAGLTITPAEDGRAIPGRGVRGLVEGKEYIISSKRILEDEGIKDDFFEKLISEREEKEETVSLLVYGEKIIALASFKDVIKDSAKLALKELKELGVKSVMITGDNKGSAALVAKELGIDEVFAEVLPEDKSRIILSLREKGEIVGMVGDGINDAPALAQAHVGMAMSTGTDVAMHSAGITLMNGNPQLIADAISVSRRTYSKIKQNLFWAFIYNVIGIPLAALGFLSPVLAGAAMALSSVSVVSNSLLLRSWKPNSQRGNP